MEQSTGKQEKIESQILNANGAPPPRGFLGFLLFLFRGIFARSTGAAHFDVLHWRDIIEWFTTWQSSHQNLKDELVGFTINETKENDKYVLVQGVFNKSTGKVEEARRIQADDVDAEVKEQCFGKAKVTIFT